MLDLAGRRFPSAKIDRSVEWLRSVLRQRQILFVLALTAAAAALRFTTLGLQSFWYDETVTVSLVQKPLVAMLRALPGSETTPPFYTSSPGRGRESSGRANFHSARSRRW